MPGRVRAPGLGCETVQSPGRASQQHRVGGSGLAPDGPGPIPGIPESPEGWPWNGPECRARSSPKRLSWGGPGVGQGSSSTWTAFREGPRRCCPLSGCTHPLPSSLPPLPSSLPLLPPHPPPSSLLPPHPPFSPSSLLSSPSSLLFLFLPLFPLSPSSPCSCSPSSPSGPDCAQPVPLWALAAPSTTRHPHALQRLPARPLWPLPASSPGCLGLALARGVDAAATCSPTH